MLSPILFAVYVDDLIDQRRCSGYGIHVGSMFIGCVVYADDIVLLSASCHGLQAMINTCRSYGRDMGYYV